VNEGTGSSMWRGATSGGGLTLVSGRCVSTLLLAEVLFDFRLGRLATCQTGLEWPVPSNG
jgi:hypothetical protein